MKKDNYKIAFYSTLIIFCIILAEKLNAQQKHNWYISAAQDVKMSYDGAHGEGGKLNPEVSFGIDFETFRLSMKYEWFSSIEYRKWTYIAVDYKPRILTNERFETLVGLETSVIYRYDPMVDHYNDNLSIGMNYEFIYWMTKSIGLSANANVFTSEKYDNKLNEMKPIRSDVRVGAILKF